MLMSVINRGVLLPRGFQEDLSAIYLLQHIMVGKIRVSIKMKWKDTMLLYITLAIIILCLTFYISSLFYQFYLS